MSVMIGMAVGTVAGLVAGPTFHAELIFPYAAAALEADLYRGATGLDPQPPPMGRACETGEAWSH